MSALLDSLIAAGAHQSHASGLSDLRHSALQRVQADGLPGARSEAWKYTSLRALERRRFEPSLPVAIAATAALDLPPAPRLVFVNGHHDAALSDAAGLPDGVSLQPLSRLLASGDATSLEFMARRFDRSDEPFARLNAGLATDGMVLRVSRAIAVEPVLHLVLLGAPVDRDVAWHLRHLVELHGDTRLTLVEHRRALGAHAHLANDVMQVQLAPGACLQHARIQHEADAATLFLRTDAVLAAGSDYQRADLELGAALSRHELDVALRGEGAKLRANGVLLAAGRRHFDTRLGIDHGARDTTCDLAWRGLGAGRGRAVFHGGILIREGADGAEAMLANKNLLLSEGAEIDTQPVLEIHADEVKAAHGATVGKLDEQALFYMRSRGVPLARARAMLTAAFCHEVLAFLDPQAQDWLAPPLAAALQQLESAA